MKVAGSFVTRLAVKRSINISDLQLQLFDNIVAKGDQNSAQRFLNTRTHQWCTKLNNKLEELNGSRAGG